MKIYNFSPETYKDCKFYVRTYGITWEFLAVIKGNLHAWNVDVKPRFFNKIKAALGLGELYSESEKRQMHTTMKAAAEATIETVLQTK